MAVDLHRSKPLISLVPCNLRLWPFKNKFLSIINIETKKKKQMLTNTKHITEIKPRRTLALLSFFACLRESVINMIIDMTH